MSQPYIEFCTLLVEEYCGRLTSQIFSLVADHGGLKESAISELTRAHPRRIQAILPVMLQQRLLQYSTNDDYQTIYHVDLQSAYHLVRLHRVVKRVKGGYGDAGAKVITRIHALGQASVGDLVKAFDLVPKDDVDTGTRCNGSGDAPQSSHVAEDVEPKAAATASTLTNEAELHSLLRSLLLNGYLAKTVARSYTPFADLQETLEEWVTDNGKTKKKGRGKDANEFDLAIDSLKRKWQEEDEYNDDRDVEHVPGAKRSKTNGFTANNDEPVWSNRSNASGPKLSNNLVVRVSFLRCQRGLRNKYLKNLANKYLGGTTANVYGALLQALENQKPRAKPHSNNIEEDEDSFTSVSVQDISEILPESVDLSANLADSRKTSKKKVKVEEDFTDIGIKQENLSDSEVQSDDDDDLAPHLMRRKRISQIEDHLRLLEQHPMAFCGRENSGGRRDWTVDFRAIVNTVIQSEIDTIITSRFGRVSVRLVRMLRDKGKLDEKQVAQYTLMRVKDVRAILTDLQYAGYVESAEVPKDTHRQAGRSIFLWNHAPDRVKGIVEQNSYECMVRILERFQQERLSFKTVTEKMEMVRDKQETLNQNDRDMIVKSREVEGKLLVQIQRIDELIAVIGKP